MFEEIDTGTPLKEEYNLEVLTEEVLTKAIDIRAREHAKISIKDDLYYATLYDSLLLELEITTINYARGLKNGKYNLIQGDEDHMIYLIGEATITLQRAKQSMKEERAYESARTEILIDIIKNSLKILSIPPQNRLKNFKGNATMNYASGNSVVIKFGEKK
ncbi:hypothetical protein HY483_02985 [Candidatus Woesearchaeota archaeon]|nr:hypothetical protein [Candidatus Woesearchaeota archaeon]